MIKLNKNQLLASGFVKIVMDSVLILKNITFYFLYIRYYIFQPTNTVTNYRISGIQSVMRFLLIYDKDTAKPCSSA